MPSDTVIVLEPDPERKVALEALLRAEGLRMVDVEETEDAIATMRAMQPIAVVVNPEHPDVDLVALRRGSPHGNPIAIIAWNMYSAVQVSEELGVAVADEAADVIDLIDGIRKAEAQRASR